MSDFEIIDDLLKFTACTNFPPTKCDIAIANCSNMFAKGFCKDDWKDFMGCNDDTPGKVEEYCKKECRVCGDEGTLLFIHQNHFLMYKSITC